MKTLLAILFAGIIAVEASVAMTLEEYLAKTPEQKLAVLRNKPDQALADASQLLRLYSISLKDSSLEVKKAAAQASVFLVMGLQEAKPLGKAPTFPIQDSADFQQALVELLNDEDKASRYAAVTALAYSSPPTLEIEKLLLATINAEKDDEIAGGMIESVAKAGYNTAQLANEVSNLIARTTDTRAAYSAGQTLAHLKPENALDLLISLAAKPNLSQRHAIQALGAYGAKASKAKSVLESLIRDHATQDDIRRLARSSLEAINTNNPPASALRQMNLIALWPLAVQSLPDTALKQTAPATQAQSSLPQNQPTTIKSAAAIPVQPVRPTPANLPKLLWWIVGTVSALVAAVLIIRRKKPKA
jgi:HEAT repeat protein